MKKRLIYAGSILCSLSILSGCYQKHTVATYDGGRNSVTTKSGGTSVHKIQKVESEKKPVILGVKDKERSKVYKSAPKKYTSKSYNNSKMNFATSGSSLVQPQNHAPHPDIIPVEQDSYSSFFKSVNEDPLSTFSIDVDNAAYSNVRSYLDRNTLPSKEYVRVEEMVNYFNYKYPQPTNNVPFSVNTEAAECPWNSDHYLVHIGLQGKEIKKDKVPASNFVFLIDVSGSMTYANKLPLLKQSMELLVKQLRKEDRISIVVYAGAAGEVLPSTSGTEKKKIIDAFNKLQAGGSTAGGAGIKLAYKIAKDNFIKDGNNRVILATDGDFNVGVSSQMGLQQLIEQKRQEGVFLTCLGFGNGNYQDAKMETLADKGNGNYYFIDQLKEAKKVLVKEMTGTMYTIAKDVKIQVEFNPTQVLAYRLVGYKNRRLANEDFNNDKKDAGELGAGHRVTALYEIIPAGKGLTIPGGVDELKYQKTVVKDNAEATGELMNIKLRYKLPDQDVSKLIQNPVKKENAKKVSESSENFRFSASVAMFGMLLGKDDYPKFIGYDDVLSLAKNSTGNDPEGYRKEFISLVKKAKSLSSPSNTGVTSNK